MIVYFYSNKRHIAIFLNLEYIYLLFYGEMKCPNLNCIESSKHRKLCVEILSLIQELQKKFGNVFAMTTIRLTLMQELQNLFGKVFAMPTIRLALMQELQNLFGKVFALPTIRLTLMQELQNLFAEVFAMPTICQFRPRNTVYWFFLHWKQPCLKRRENSVNLIKSILQKGLKSNNFFTKQFSSKKDFLQQNWYHCLSFIGPKVKISLKVLL